jgi:serine/threonine protein kinase
VQLEDTLDAVQAGEMWQSLADRAQAFTTAWNQGKEPALADYLPADPAALRQLTLVELVKIDLAQRFRRKQPKLLEVYQSEYRELAERLPCDLIYEELHVRRENGESPDLAEYRQRFPNQATELERLVGRDTTATTTLSLVAAKRPEPAEVGERLDDFDLISILGKGAFATVYLARQRTMQRLVALKVSAEQSDEPQTMAQLDHPHIVRVFDQRHLTEQKLRLLYMQYVPGGTLQSVVDAVRRTPADARNGQLLLSAIDRAMAGSGDGSYEGGRRRLSQATWPEIVCWLGSKLALALEYAHRRGVLHRDIKPANVLLAADGGPKLADFNVSFSSKLEGATPAAYFGGSLAYMSPEQLEAANPGHARDPGEITGASDVYSLGVMLWELLTGNRPLREEQSPEGWLQTLNLLAARRREGVPASVRNMLPANTPPGLDQVLLKCLAPDPRDRWPTAGHLARQLQLCLQPKVQRLIRPAPGSWRQVVSTWPALAMVLAGLFPNAIAGLLNIAYNLNEIVLRLTPAEQDFFRNVQLVTVNGVAFSLGIALGLWAILPVLAGAKALQAGKSCEPERQAWLRRRALTLGDWVAWITLAEWLISGVAFPLWIRLHTGPSSALELSHYLHFMASQLLCGLISGAMCFFLVTFLVVRFVYPVLSPPDTTDEGAIDAMVRLGQRMWLYFALAVSAPFLAVTALVVIDTQARLAFAVMGGVGLVGFGMAFFLSRAIQGDLGTLAMAISPAGDSISSTSEATESFWTGSWTRER